MRQVLLTLILVLLSAGAASAAATGRRVLFVDAARAGGDGTREHPFTTIGEAAAAANAGTIIYVAEAAEPYEESVSLRKGQMLIGSAFGLDAVISELHVETAAPAVPAMKGTGPVIHGSIVLAGENVVAGCTLVADRRSGPALVASAPSGPLTFRALYVRTSEDALAFYLESSIFPAAWTGGGIDSTNGSGIAIAGGNGDVIFDHVRVSGVFSTAIAIRGRSGGAVVFRNDSPVDVTSAGRDGVVIESSKGRSRFESPLRIRSSGARGLVVNHASLAITDGRSWIESAGAGALDIRDADADVVLDHVSAAPSGTGRLTDGIILDKIRGRFEIRGGEGRAGSGGTIREAGSYAIRATQSSDLRLMNMTISGGGTIASAEECPSDVTSRTNLRCVAALYLRHVERSSFENISISSNAGVGVNANNVSELTFADVHVAGTGSDGNEPALLIDEVRGAVSFVRCSFVDGSGGSVRIEQQFNKGRVTFDRCEIAAAGRPGAAPFLLRATVRNIGGIGVTMLNSRIHDNTGGGISIDATVDSSGVLTLRDSYFINIGAAAVDATAGDRARIAVVPFRNRFSLTEGRSEPLLNMRLMNHGTGCIDAAANELSGASNAAFTIAASRDARLQLVGASTAGDLAARNNGLIVTTDAKSVVSAASCD